MIKSLKEIVRRMIFAFITHPSEYLKNSYSQAGEDAIVRFLFESKMIKNPSYLELGVFLPDFHNNTYLFYKLGSKGVLVEADESLIERIRKVRPNDKTLNVGVGLTNLGSSVFYVFDEPALNTFDKEEAGLRVSIGTYKVIKTIDVPMKTLGSIIEDNFDTYPHFLSIDLEGLDLLVLQSLDLEKFPIPVICAETCKYSENHIKEKNKEIIEWLVSKGYFVYGDTYINTIFVNKDWFFS